MVVAKAVVAAGAAASAAAEAAAPSLLLATGVQRLDGALQGAPDGFLDPRFGYLEATCEERAGR